MRKSSTMGVWVLAGTFLAGAFSDAGAQTGLLDINFILGNPRDEFQDNVDQLGIGGSLAAGYQFPRSPLMFGADIAFMIYGSETRSEPFSSNIPDVTVDVETSNNIFQGHLFMRLHSDRGVLRPYMDGLIGLNYLFTQTKIRNEGFIGEVVAESTNQSDVAFSYGAGGGVMIRVARLASGEKNAGNKLKEVLLNFRVRYIFGGEADYLKEGSIRREDGEVIYDLTRSRTDLLTFEVGVGLGF